MAPSSSTAHHALAVHEVLTLMEADPDQGLSDQEAADRLHTFGPNTLPARTTTGPLVRLVRQVHHPLIYVLIVAGVITAALGEHVDSGVIFGVVVVNALIGFVQEAKAETALEGLRTMVRTQARVVRDGRPRSLSSDDLVPGDLVLLEAGDKVPADLRLIRTTDLRVDESALSGESVPAAKDGAALPEATTVVDRSNTAYSGTLVTTGGGAGIVVATGATTELGQIHRLVGAAQTLATPLTQKLAAFSKLLTVVILALAAVTFAVGLMRGQDATQTFTAAIALAVGAIPEGLPAAVTITLAIGVARMARQQAVIRRLPAAETLGSITVICTDKTGTLTENQMTVRTLWTPGELFQVSGTGYTPRGVITDPHGEAAALAEHPALRWSLLAGVACNDAALVEDDDRWSIVGDPTEAALLVVGAKAGLDAAEVAGLLPRVATTPFTSERQHMLTRHLLGAAGGPDATLLLVKGSVERLVAMCAAQMGRDGATRPLDREAALGAADHLAAQGLRVLATAVRPPGATHTYDAARPDDAPDGLVLTGLQAMLDPPRAGAAAAVAACHTAGVEVKMITGDHAATATAIADQVGLLDGHGPAPGTVLTGTDLASMSAADLPGAVARASVFARVSPEQKLRLVEALQAGGHVVAMTGDGVNDAPALRRANVGVAMGRTGTEVAKDAADMVLVDDDFATIEAAIEEGRGAFDNLTKFINWTLPTNLAEGLVILVAIVLGAALPILPTQILWINMTTAVLLGLMLAFEPKEDGIMTRPPRDPDQPLLTRALVERLLLVCTLLVAGSWWLFTWERAAGAGLAEARTAALNLFVVVEAFYLFHCRSLTLPVWRVRFFSNPWILVGIGLQSIGQLAITYVPAMNATFGTAPLGVDVWVRILVAGSIASLVVALHTGWQSRRART
ncbi:putative cation-transporting ATPase F [Nocardioides dokdonensis FR1436]|uniref:Putative cation-transporting ATPase F n=1 Tax=Nocardioides dokdonensis FR1436 TaxID=1300347 RepID=A0A1A9GP41_9ACTN|nr:HAD-IC family P-type ATPase [Nocardioides dokdonensis]ANH39241.1 putative cation-transporting ATPase F [Nocardioides dokdonensis FR1436]